MRVFRNTSSIPTSCGFGAGLLLFAALLKVLGRGRMGVSVELELNISEGFEAEGNLFYDVAVGRIWL